MDGVPVKYRLSDSFEVKRWGSVYWTLTFVPYRRGAPGRESSRHLVVTIPDDRYQALRGHGPVYTADEIEAMETPTAPRRDGRKGG
jgi:hypothetical protein